MLHARLYFTRGHNKLGSSLRLRLRLRLRCRVILALPLRFLRFLFFLYFSCRLRVCRSPFLLRLWLPVSV